MTQDDSANKTQATQAKPRGDLPIPPGMTAADISAVAFHDVTCPAREHCANRLVHAQSHDLVRSGILQQYDEKSWDLCLSFARHVSATQVHSCGKTIDSQYIHES